MATSTLSWEDPPPVRRKYDWDAIAAQLESRPGKWAKVFERGPTSTVNAIRQDSVRALTSFRGFEIKTSNNVREPDRTCTLYLRYNPDKDTRRNGTSPDSD